MYSSQPWRSPPDIVEITLLNSPEGVKARRKSAAAIAIPDEEIGNRLFAFATLARDDGASDNELDADAVLSHVRARLPKHMVPERLILRRDLPRTSTNKIDRKRLRDELQEESES